VRLSDLERRARLLIDGYPDPVSSKNGWKDSWVANGEACSSSECREKARVGFLWELVRTQARDGRTPTNQTPDRVDTQGRTVRFTWTVRPTTGPSGRSLCGRRHTGGKFIRGNQGPIPLNYRSSGSSWTARGDSWRPAQIPVRILDLRTRMETSRTEAVSRERFGNHFGAPVRDSLRGILHLGARKNTAMLCRGKRSSSTTNISPMVRTVPFTWSSARVYRGMITGTKGF
jgi:hypothetical protein